jgi:hypothetical protein
MHILAFLILWCRGKLVKVLAPHTITQFHILLLPGLVVQCGWTLAETINGNYSLIILTPLWCSRHSICISINCCNVH